MFRIETVGNLINTTILIRIKEHKKHLMVNNEHLALYRDLILHHLPTEEENQRKTVNNYLETSHIFPHNLLFSKLMYKKL